MTEGIITINELIFLFVTSHIYVVFLLKALDMDYTIFVISINLIYFITLTIVQLFKIKNYLITTIKESKFYKERQKKRE